VQNLANFQNVLMLPLAYIELWNSLPVYLRQSDSNFEHFIWLPKTFLFWCCWCVRSCILSFLLACLILFIITL